MESAASPLSPSDPDPTQVGEHTDQEATDANDRRQTRADAEGSGEARLLLEVHEAGAAVQSESPPSQVRRVASAAQRRRGPRAWRIFLWALAAFAFLEAPAHYPNLSFHGFLGALPWPVYVVQGCVWSYLGWSLGRVR